MPIGPTWYLDVRKKCSGINFFARFWVPIYDIPYAPRAEQREDSVSTTPALEGIAASGTPSLGAIDENVNVEIKRIFKKGYRVQKTEQGWAIKEPWGYQLVLPSDAEFLRYARRQ